MEAVVILLALVVGGLLVVRSGDRDTAPPRTLWTPSAARVAVLGSSPLPVRLYHASSPAPDSGDGDVYTLTLARQADGQWRSVLRAAEVARQGGTLTVTLVVPWAELMRRYSALNLVVR